MGKKQGAGAPAWDERDEALWATAEIGLLLAQGRIGERRPAGTPFAPTLAPGEECVYAFSPFALHDYRSPGDGSYIHNSGTVLAVGRGAVPLMLGAAVGQAMGNASRRKRAAAMSQPQWMQIDGGTLSVGSHGFYLHTPTSLLTWGWGSISLMTLVGPGHVQIMGDSQNGPINWILQSNLAELVFLLWATVRHPGHEQLTGRAWLPQEWIDKVRRRDLATTTPGRDFQHMAEQLMLDQTKRWPDRI